MNILLEYISYNYMTLMLLAGLTVILTANRKTKINGVQYVWGIMAIVLALTICEYVEVWCDTYYKSLWILYVKAALSYTLHPLLIVLEVYLIAPIRHKILILIPFFADFGIIITDLFGANLIYGYTPAHAFSPGKLHSLPAWIICFYMILLLKYSLDFLNKEEYSKAMIVFFMLISTFITVYLEYFNIIIDHTTDIAALDMLVYYFYLGAIHQREIQGQLHEQEIELEKSKNALLLAQIQPHFIFNSLMAIRSQCTEYPEVYASVTSFSHYLRSNLEAIGENTAITFRNELRNIEAYLALEKLNYGERLKIEYDIESDDFLLPALSVQPLVENAVRHGIGTRPDGGTVKIVQRDEEERIIIEVIDDGRGSSVITEQQKKRRGIGIENVRARLRMMNQGELEILMGENGTTARIILHEFYYEEEST